MESSGFTAGNQNAAHSSRVVAARVGSMEYRISCERDVPSAHGRRHKKELVAVGAGVAVFANLFLGPLARQSLFHTTLLTWLQVIRMPLYFLNNVFCLNFAFKPAQRVFQRLAFL
jgi:hypothetical protein